MSFKWYRKRQARSQNQFLMFVESFFLLLVFFLSFYLSVLVPQSSLGGIIADSIDLRNLKIKTENYLLRIQSSVAIFQQSSQYHKNANLNIQTIQQGNHSTNFIDVSPNVTVDSDKLGRKTGHFSVAEKFSLLFSFSVLRPKTNQPKKYFVEAYGRNQDQIVLRK